MARALLDSASSEFLQLDDEISRKLDFSIVGRKFRPIKVNPQKFSTPSKALLKPSSTSASVVNMTKDSAEFSPKNATKPEVESRSGHEMAAMEIWKRNANKDFGGKKKQGKKKSHKKSMLSFKNNNDSPNGQSSVLEMIVGVGAGQSSKAMQEKNVSNNEDLPMIANGGGIMKKKRNKKLHKRNHTLVKVKESGSGSKISGFGLTHSENGESSMNIVETSRKLANRRPSWKMNIQEVEDFIAQKSSEVAKSGNCIREMMGNPIMKRKDTPYSEIPSPKHVSAGDLQKDTELSDLEIQPLPKDASSMEILETDPELSSSQLQSENENSDEQDKLQETVQESPDVTQTRRLHCTTIAKVVPPLLRASNMMEMSQYLYRVQTYIDQLGYDREAEPDTTVNIRLSVKHLMSTAKTLIKLGQPIKCLHALILSVHFTNHIPLVERFPIHFKSKVNGKEYKHVVLGVYVQGHFGALGISRDPGLQDKPTVYTRLSELINNYYQCYIQSGHLLKELKVGAIITHDPHSIEKITWKMGKVSFDLEPEKIESEIEKISKKLRSQMGSACLRGVRLDQYNSGPPQRIAGSMRIVRTENNFFPQDPTMRSRSIPLSHLKRNEWRDLEAQLMNAPIYTPSRTRPYKPRNK